MLSKETQERIGKDADKYAFQVPFDGTNDFYDDKLHKGYIDGAISEATRAQILEEALEKIANNSEDKSALRLQIFAQNILNQYRNAP